MTPPTWRRHPESPVLGVEQPTAAVQRPDSASTALFTRHTRGTINADRDRRRLRRDNGGANPYRRVTPEAPAGMPVDDRDQDRWIGEGGSSAPRRGTPGPARAVAASASR